MLEQLVNSYQLLDHQVIKGSLTDYYSLYPFILAPLFM